MRFCLFAVLSVAVSTLPTLAQQPAAPPAATPPAAAPAYASDQRYVAAMAEAAQMMKHRRYSFAEDALKKADKIAEGKSEPCLDQLFTVQLGLNNNKGALATAERLEALAQTPLAKSLAKTDSAQALIRQAGEKGKPAQLEAAHGVLQSALTDYPKNVRARYTDACVLARLGKMDEASKEFGACADAARPTDAMRVRARHFAEDPSLALHKMAPAFEVTALDGTRFNLDSMVGRVVLVDFWATWCGPCNAELPNVKRMAREFKDEPFTVISISWDKNEEAWKNFIAKNEMTWLQYRDADHLLSDQFNVEAIPHYFTIDSDGVLTAEVLGSGSNIEGKIRKLLKKAHDSHPAQMAVAGTR